MSLYFTILSSLVLPATVFSRTDREKIVAIGTVRRKIIFFVQKNRQETNDGRNGVKVLLDEKQKYKMIFKYSTFLICCTIVLASVVFCGTTERSSEKKSVGEELQSQEIFPSEATATGNRNVTDNVDNGTTLEMNVNETVQHFQGTNKTQKFVHCLSGMGSPVVQLTNDTELIKLLQPDPKVTDRDIPGLCVVVLFYSKFCPFSSMAAPHYNALPRAFPDIKMVAINAMMYHLFNTQNGIVGVPSVMLFHSGRPVAKFNDSEYTLEQFSKFISKYTGITAAEKSTVTSSDFAGPIVSNPSKEFDILLVISWAFIAICSGYYFTKSKWWRWIIETIQSNWRESEAHAQHEHLD